MEVLDELLGESPQIRTLRSQISRLLQRQAAGRRLPPLLLLGETGTGKGLTARLLHRASARSAGPFVALNCAALPETLLESELFGFERGAFTDAHRSKQGLFQAANRGTLFLDEIGAVPLGVQSKLLTAIEERTIRRLGGIRPEPVDLWILAATSEDLAIASTDGRFRADLYHRLSAFVISLPPLRARGRDVIDLAKHFLASASHDYGLAPFCLAPDAEAALLAYEWPGNVRELANFMERVAVVAEGNAIHAADLSIPTSPSRSPQAATSPSSSARETPLRASLGVYEREQIQGALESAGGNLSHAAARLGIPRNTLRYRLAKHGLRADSASPGSPARTRTVEDRPAAEAAPVTQIATRECVVAFLLTTFEGDGPSRPADLSRVEVIEEKVRAFGGRIEDLGERTAVSVFGLSPATNGPAAAVHAALAIRNAAEHAAREGEARLSIKTLIHVVDCRIAVDEEEGEIEARLRDDALATLASDAAGIDTDAVFVTLAAMPFLQPRFVVVPSAAAGSRPRVARLVAATPVLAGKPSIAVLPFRNLSNEPDQEYFGDGITEDIIGALSRLRWLVVICRTSTLVYKTRVVDIRQIAAELGVRYILTGTVRRLGTELRVTTDLVDAEAGHSVWAERFDGSTGHIFEFQDEITARIAATLDTRVRYAEIQRATRKRPENLDAYDCVLRSLALMHRLTSHEFAQAGDLLGQATALDPGFAAAYAWRAWWHLFRIGQGWASRADVSEVARLADLALEHDPDDPMALAISGHTASFVRGDTEVALRRFERSLALNPNSAFAWGMSAATFCYHGQPRIALDRVRHALRLSPFDLAGFIFATIASLAEMLLGRFEEAIEWGRRAYDENPRFSATLRQLAACLAQLDRMDEARQMADRFVTIETDFRLSTFRERYPLSDTAALDLYVANLRKLGLPE